MAYKGGLACNYFLQLNWGRNLEFSFFCLIYIYSVKYVDEKVAKTCQRKGQS